MFTIKVILAVLSIISSILAAGICYKKNTAAMLWAIVCALWILNYLLVVVSNN